jgi:hypothetical protein
VRFFRQINTSGKSSKFLSLSKQHFNVSSLDAPGTDRRQLALAALKIPECDDDEDETDDRLTVPPHASPTTPTPGPTDPASRPCPVLEDDENVENDLESSP